MKNKKLIIMLSVIIIPDSVTFLHCRAFDDIVVITKPDNLVCEAPLE